MKIQKLSVLLVLLIVFSSCTLNKPNTKSGIGGNTIPEDNTTANANVAINNENYCSIEATPAHIAYKVTLDSCFVTSNWAEAEVSDEYVFSRMPDATTLEGNYVFIVADIKVENIENPYNSDNIISARAFRVWYGDDLTNVPVAFQLNETEKVKWKYDVADYMSFHDFVLDVGTTAEIRLVWKIRRDKLSDLKLIVDVGSSFPAQVDIEKGLYISMHPDFKEG